VNPLLVVLLLALIGLVGARLLLPGAQEAVGPRILIAIGVPFIFLGFLLGPHLARVISQTVLEDLTPLIALGLGWIGLLFGLQLDRDHLKQFPRRYLLLAWLQAGVAFAIVFVLGELITDAWFSMSFGAVLLATAATASVSTPAAIAVVSNTYHARGPTTRFLFYVASLDAAVGILALGLTSSAFHPGMLALGEAMSLVEWFVISILLGCFFGVLLLSVTRIRPSGEELVLVLMGLVLFASGTAFYLALSPLFVCMIAGIVISNLSPIRRRIYSALVEWEKPIYVVMLVLAGALLEFPSWWIAPLTAAYVTTRLLAKWLGGLAASRLRPRGLNFPNSFGLALTPQGGISLAMAISFNLIYVPTSAAVETAVEIFFATVVIAVGISDLFGPFLVRNVLERVGELGSSATQPAR